MEITPACYAHLLHSLTSFAQGKVAVILEVSCFHFLSELISGSLCLLCLLIIYYSSKFFVLFYEFLVVQSMILLVPYIISFNSRVNNNYPLF